MARGSNHISLDATGRIAIPTKLRSKLVGDTDGALVITISPHERCLLMYRLHDWEAVEEKLSSMPNMKEQTRSLTRMLIGHAEDCMMDGNGRILLTQQLRDHASIDRKAVLVGQGSKYEIWGEQQWLDKRREMLSTPINEADLPADMQAFSL